MLNHPSNEGHHVDRDHFLFLCLVILVPVRHFLTGVADDPSYGYRRRGDIFGQVFGQASALLWNFSFGHMGNKSSRVFLPESINQEPHLRRWNHLLKHLEEMILPLLVDLIRKIPQLHPLTRIFVDPSTAHDNVKMRIIVPRPTMSLHHNDRSNLHLLSHRAAHHIFKALVPTTHQC